MLCSISRIDAYIDQEYYVPSARILLYMLPHTTIYVTSAILSLGQPIRNTMHIAPAYFYICVLILLYMRPHTAIYITSVILSLGQPHRTPSCNNIRQSVHRILSMCPHTTVYVARCQYLYFGTSKARKLRTKYLSRSLSGASSQDAALQQHTKYTYNESSSRNSKPLERLRCHLRMPGEVLHDASFKSGTASISASCSVAASGDLAGTHFGRRCQYFCPFFLLVFFLFYFCPYVSRVLRGRVGRFSWHALWTQVSAFGTRFTCFTSPKVQILRGRVGRFRLAGTRFGRRCQYLVLSFLALLVQKYQY